MRASAARPSHGAAARATPARREEQMLARRASQARTPMPIASGSAPTAGARARSAACSSSSGRTRSAPFIAAIEQALQYGLFDLGRLEALILEQVAGDFFALDDETQGEGDDDA